MSVASSVAAPTGTSTVGPAVTNADSPISQLIPYAFSWLKYFLSSISSFWPPLLLWPLPILLYLFSPVVMFAKIFVTVFFSGPYKFVLYLLEALYPLYVLGGVACITGGVLGLAGRQLCRLLVHFSQVRSEDTRSKTPAVDLKDEELEP